MMAVADETANRGAMGGGAASAALKAAAAAAATGAATYAVRKVRSHNDNDTESSGHDDTSSEKNGSSKTKSGGGSQGMIASAVATSWDAASDVLMPMAEEAAGAAGKYLAEHGPDVVRERIVPK